jgi:hypothetical protein
MVARDGFHDRLLVAAAGLKSVPKIGIVADTAAACPVLCSGGL